MRKLLLVLVFIAAIGTIKAQNTTEKPDGFWGIKFGATAEEAQKIMSEKEGCKFIKTEEDGTIVYADGTFSGLSIRSIFLSFIDDNFYYAIIVLNPDNESSVFSDFRKFKEKLDSKYFKTEVYNEEFSTPYYKSDGRELQALKNGKANFSAIWSFGNETSIVLFLHTEVQLVLMYTDKKLEAIADARKETKEINDL